MTNSIQRRVFLQSAAIGAAGLALTRTGLAQDKGPDKLYDISLAQWSLNRQFFSFLGHV